MAAVRPRALPAAALLAALAVAAVLAGCRADAEPAPPPSPADVVAVVAGVPITAEDFERTYLDHLLRTGQPDTEADRWAHLERMADEVLLAAEARQRGLDADPAVQAAVALQHDQALASTYYDRAFLAALPPPTEDEVRTAYAKSEAQAVVRHALFRTEAEAAAARAAVAAGRPFADVAAQSFGVAADSAGVVGPVSFFELDDAFSEAAFGQQVGEVSGPVRTAYGWHLVQTLDLISAPLLTADGLETRREGLTNQVAQRKRRMAGGDFVRAQMEALDVRVRPDALRQLARAVADLDALPAPEEGPGELRVEDAQAVAEALAPGTVLLTYREGGAERAFTAGDFARWLPALPFAEVARMPAAAVGRALRNEVFARRGEAQGLGADPFVRRETARTERQLLADLLRETLRQGAPDRAPADLVAEATDRLEDRLPRTVRADLWAVPAPSAAAAEALLARIRSGADPAALPGFERHRDVALLDLPALRALARQAPLGAPVVGGLEDGRWAVLRVDRRDEERIRLTPAQRDSVSRRLAPAVPEYRLVRRLRQRAEVQVDTLAFRALVDAARPGRSAERPAL